MIVPSVPKKTEWIRDRGLGECLVGRNRLSDIKWYGYACNQGKRTLLFVSYIKVQENNKNGFLKSEIRSIFQKDCSFNNWVF